jgi:hypothetical protein
VLHVTPNKEDDWDFRIQTGAGPKDLEITEFAPLKSNYDQADDLLNVGKCADDLFDQVLAKSEHYGGYTGPGLVLLFYVTHYAFELIEDVFELAVDRLSVADHRFERIFFMIPMLPHYPAASDIRQLYPSQGSRLAVEVVEAKRNRWFGNGDLSSDAQGFDSRD